VDIATIIGIFAAFSMVIIAMISGGGLTWFHDGPSALIVLGGTVEAILINYRLSDMLGVLKVAQNVFFLKDYLTDQIIELIVEMSRVTWRDGILALQDITKKIKNPFLVKAVDMMVDGLEPVDMANILETEPDFIAERHRIGADIFTSMRNSIPDFKGRNCGGSAMCHGIW